MRAVPRLTPLVFTCGHSVPYRQKSQAALRWDGPFHGHPELSRPSSIKRRGPRLTAIGVERSAKRRDRALANYARVPYECQIEVQHASSVVHRPVVCAVLSHCSLFLER
jgi:hypothetical protein